MTWLDLLAVHMTLKSFLQRKEVKEHYLSSRFGQLSIAPPKASRQNQTFDAQLAGDLGAPPPHTLF